MRLSPPCCLSPSWNRTLAYTIAARQFCEGSTLLAAACGPRPVAPRLPSRYFVNHADYGDADYGDSLLYVSQQLRLLRGVPLHSRLWAGFAGCQRAAEPALEHRDPFWPPKRAADGGSPLDPGRRRRVGRRGEKRREIRDQCAQQRQRASSSSSPASCARVLDHG